MTQIISVDVFGSNDFIYLDGKRKNNYILSATADETRLPYIRPFVAIKGGQWKMSSVTRSLILQWLSSSCGSDTVISSNAGSWLNRLSSSGRDVLPDGVAQVPRQLNWHYINSLCQGTQRGKQQQCRMYRFGQVTLSKRQTLGIKWHSRGKAFAVMKAGDDILNHICHSWHSTQWLPMYFHLAQFSHQMKWVWNEMGLAFCQSSCAKWHHCEDMSTGGFCAYSKKSDWCIILWTHIQAMQWCSVFCILHRSQHTWQENMTANPIHHTLHCHISTLNNLYFSVLYDY